MTRRRDGERGSLTLMLAVLFVVLLALAGIVIDGGAKLDEQENASSLAQEAARAGAGMVSRTTAYSAGRFVVDDSQALAAARNYLAVAKSTGTGTGGATIGRVSVTAARNSITVSVTLTQPTRVLSLIGIGSMAATGSATASLAAGVTGPGR